MIYSFTIYTAAAIVFFINTASGTLLQFDPDRAQRSLEELTERSIYLALAFTDPHDICLERAMQDPGPVGAYARQVVETRHLFSQTPSMKRAIKHIFGNPDREPLNQVLAAAQDRLYNRLMMLSEPGPIRAALIKYAVWRRQGVQLNDLQRQLSNDPAFRELNTSNSLPVLRHPKFPLVLRAFEQDIVDGAVQTAEALGHQNLKQAYVKLALSQLDAHIQLRQHQMGTECNNNAGASQRNVFQPRQRQVITL